MKRLSKLIIILLLLVGCTKQPEQVKPSVNSVYYEIFVASFKDSDGDGVGDLQGIIEELDYLQSLGVTGIWLMPIHPSDTYHKYDVLDYYEIDESYGTMKDFEALVTEMNKREMDLIIDLVLNHTSIRNAWFQKATSAIINNQCEVVPYCDYYNFKSEYDSGYHQLMPNVYYESVFWDQMPDLNLDNPDVRNEITSIVNFWLAKGIKGFRLDATTHYYRENTHDNTAFLKWLNETIKENYPEAYIVGEAWTTSAIITQMYESGIDSFFDFSMSQNSGNIVSSINKGEGYNLARKVTEYNQEIKRYNTKGIDAVFLSNHDNNRSAGYLVEPLKQRLAASIYLLMPGNVFIYYGEEVGMKGSGKDENKRLAMPWSNNASDLANSPSDADYSLEQPLTVKDALKDKGSLWYHYQHVLRIRNSFADELARGEFVLVNYDEALYALEYKTVIVVHNLSADSVEFSQTHSSINKVQGGYKVDKEVITLDGYSSIVIVK